MIRLATSRTSAIYYSCMQSALGPITFARTKRGLCKIMYGDGDAVIQSLERWAKKYFLNSECVRDHAALSDVEGQLAQYFQGARTSFDCELDVYGTPFQKLVWKELMNIPYGQVFTYKQVACNIGSRLSVRAVGGANNKNPLPIVIPCHRVIGSNGALVGYASGLHIKEQLLVLEGYEGTSVKRA